MKKFCPNCGKETLELHESLCRDCYAQKFKKNIFKKKMNISICKCTRLGYNQQWKKNITLDDFIKSIIEKELKAIYKNYDEYGFSFDKKEMQDSIVVYVKAEKNKIKIAEYTYHFRIKNRMCPVCSSEKKGYYEAVLQLRADKNVLNDFVNIVDNIVASYKGQNSFAKIVGQKSNAVDMHLGTKKILDKIKKEISSKYKIETKASYSLYKVKDGREIYRTTLLIREK
ncbi:MAG: hypothetical protein DRN66_01975 [Candidatus Nanohalarchaeota archaeon]|nr:MAG: hypothetical protein DRN66_01975 [Candidatus Nanohaloarchaeota archaeon]